MITLKRLILPWARLNIHLDLGEERQDQIKADVFNAKKYDASQKQIKPGLIPIMAMRAALMEEKKPVLYSTWIPKPLKNPNKHHYLCWRAEDRRQILGSQIHTIVVYNFYKDLIINNQTCITDITYWMGEKLLLAGVNLIDPRQGFD